MEFGEIFRDAIKYPFLDYQKLLILGVLYVLINVPTILGQFGFRNGAVSIIFFIVFLVLNLIILGFTLDVIKNAVNLNDEIPDFDWTKNFVDGIKYLLVAIAYYIIPTIVVSIIGFASLSSFFAAIGEKGWKAISSATSPDVAISAIPAHAWSSLATGLTVTLIVGIILFLIFAIFKTVGLCRLAKYGSLDEAFKFGEIIDNIKEIGILRIIGFLIVLIIMVTILGMVIGFLSIIPYVGIIIGYIVGNSFIALFYNRAVGLLYSDI